MRVSNTTKALGKRIGVLTLGAALACCGAPTKTPPRAAASASPVASSSASAAVDDGPVIGPPVLVPQLDGFTTIVLSPDGKLALARTWRGVYVVDLQSGLAKGFAPLTCVSDLDFTGDGQRALLTVCDEKLLRVWRLTDDTWSEVPISIAGARLARPITATTVAVVDDRSRGDRGARPLNPRMDVVDIVAGTIETIDVASYGDVGALGMTAEGAIYIGADSLILVKKGAAPRTFTAPAPIIAASTDPSRRFAALSLNPSGKENDAPTDLIVDLETLEVSASGQLCVPGWTDSIAFTGDGQHVVAGCRSPGSVVVADAGLAVQRNVNRDVDRGWVETSGNRVLVAESTTREVSVCDVLDLDHPITKLPYTSYHRLSADGTRLLLSTSDTDRVFDVERGKELWSRVDGEASARITATAPGLLLAEDVYDVARHQNLGKFAFTADGQVKLRIAEDGGSIQFQERAPSGKSWRIDALQAGSGELSAHGRYLVTQSIEYKTRLGANIWVIHSETSERSIPSKTPSLALSPKEDLAATSEPCENDPSGDCAFIRLTTLATGATSTLKVPGPAYRATPLAFSASGRELLVRDAVYDVVMKNELWTLAPDETLMAFLPGAPVAVLMTSATPDVQAVIRLRDATTGKLIGSTEADAFVGASYGGPFVLAARAGRLVLVDARTATATPLSLRAPSTKDTSYVTDDGAFVWTRLEGTLVAHRVADGRSLALRTGHGTDEGVIDAGATSSTLFATRRGPSILRSPMEPSTEFPPAFARVDLASDFFASKPVSPTP